MDNLFVILNFLKKCILPSCDIVKLVNKSKGLVIFWKCKLDKNGAFKYNKEEKYISIYYYVI